MGGDMGTTQQFGGMQNQPSIGSPGMDALTILSMYFGGAGGGTAAGGSASPGSLASYLGVGTQSGAPITEGMGGYTVMSNPSGGGPWADFLNTYQMINQSPMNQSANQFSGIPSVGTLPDGGTYMLPKKARMF